MGFIKRIALVSVLSLVGCLPNNRRITYHQTNYPLPEPQAFYNPLQFPDRAGQRITPRVSPHPSHQRSANQIIESRERIRFQRTHRNPDYAQVPGNYRSMQEAIDAQTAGADPRDKYDRAKAARIRARIIEQQFWKTVELRTGRKPEIKRTNKSPDFFDFLKKR